MDTSNSLESRLDFRPWDLWPSEHQVDRGHGMRIEGIVKNLVKKLVPILSYLAVPVTITSEVGHTGLCRKVRALPFGMPKHAFVSSAKYEGRAELFLREDGELFVGIECPHPGDHAEHVSSLYHAIFKDSDSAWGHFPFFLIVKQLSFALKLAEQKREQHLAAIKERSRLLSEIEALLQK